MAKLTVGSEQVSLGDQITSLSKPDGSVGRFENCGPPGAARPPSKEPSSSEIEVSIRDSNRDAMCFQTTVLSRLAPSGILRLVLAFSTITALCGGCCRTRQRKYIVVTNFGQHVANLMLRGFLWGLL